MKKKYLIPLIFFVLILIFSRNIFVLSQSVFQNNEENDNIKDYILNFYTSKNDFLLKNDGPSLKSLYDTSGKFGVWAYEFEMKKIGYINNWSAKQGVKFQNIVPRVEVQKIKNKQNGTYSCYIIIGTKYTYSYNGMSEPNSFIVGTYHSLTIKKLEDGSYIATKEWYMDPLFDNLDLSKMNVTKVNDTIINNIPNTAYTISEKRTKALEYASKFYGAANDQDKPLQYNKEYRNYNPLGGDCANFLSQVLKVGGFKKNKIWNYDSDGGSRSWVNAEALTNYMANSKRATVISKGKYERILKDSYKLKPGDFIAYERNNTIVHVSLVTGKDSKGYTLVSCHNADRNGVPFDIGFSGDDVKYYLVSVHY